MHLVEGYEEFMPRVLIADDHPVVRRGILGILQSSPEWELCGQADNGRDAVRLTGELKPDVAILDVSMPGLNGVEAARIICEQFPATKVMLLTLHSSIDGVKFQARWLDCGPTDDDLRLRSRAAPPTCTSQVLHIRGLCTFAPLFRL